MKGKAFTAAVVAAMVAACNSLTGADDLGVFVEAPVNPAPEGGTPPSVPTSTSGEPSLAPPDAADAAEVVDAGDDAPSLSDVDQPSPCTFASVGPRYGTSATAPSDTWSSLRGALVPRAIDDNWAHTNDKHAAPLVVTGFGFKLPANARVKGILVEIARSGENSGSYSLADKAIALPKGVSKANGPWPRVGQNDPYPTTTYGGPDDLWGAAWTPEEINAASFGVSVTGQGVGDGHVDYISVTVRYCTP